MSKPFDVISKVLVEAGPEGWPRALGLPVGPATVIDADASTVSGAADKVLRVEAATPYLLHLDFFAGHDTARAPTKLRWYNVVLDHRHDLPVSSVAVLVRPEADSPRLTGELVRGLPRRPPRVGGLLVNLTGRPRPRHLNMVLPTHPEVYHRFSVQTRNLATDSASQTLDAAEAGRLSRCVLPWIPLMQGGAESAIIGRWRRLAEAEPDEALRADYAGTVQVFAELTDRRELWADALEDFNVQRSVTVQDWERQGQLKMQRENVLRGLRLRFRTDPPRDIAEAVANMTNLDELSRWLDAVVTTDSFDAFRAAVQAPSPAGPSS